jgi:hypothetical protein
MGRPLVTRRRERLRECGAAGLAGQGQCVHVCRRRRRRGLGRARQLQVRTELGEHGHRVRAAAAAGVVRMQQSGPQRYKSRPTTALACAGSPTPPAAANRGRPALAASRCSSRMEICICSRPEFIKQTRLANDLTRRPRLAARNSAKISPPPSRSATSGTGLWCKPARSPHCRPNPSLAAPPTTGVARRRRSRSARPPDEPSRRAAHLGGAQAGGTQERGQYCRLVHHPDKIWRARDVLERCSFSHMQTGASARMRLARIVFRRSTG